MRPAIDTIEESELPFIPADPGRSHNNILLAGANLCSLADPTVISANAKSPPILQATSLSRLMSSFQQQPGGCLLKTHEPLRTNNPPPVLYPGTCYSELPSFCVGNCHLVFLANHSQSTRPMNLSAGRIFPGTLSNLHHMGCQGIPYVRAQALTWSLAGKVGSAQGTP